MDLRRQKILEAIIESFIQFALPVGSKHLTEFYNFEVSPATIRNEMAALEREGYITQPHTSAGRVPTSRAYRMLVDRMQEQVRLSSDSSGDKLARRAQDDMLKIRKQYYLNKTKEKLYDTVSILATATDNVSFATIPDKGQFFFIGISNFLKKPEFMAEPDKLTKVVEVLEHDLARVLSDLEITEEGAIYIGEENILPEFQSCSLLATPYSHQGFKGVMGILGSTRMNYAYNMAALKSAVQFLTQ
jgi:transcriptional regulator of heat shock response